MAKIFWLALSYALPINPSKMRVYTWRKLREFGAEYLRPGVAVLPHTAQSNQHFMLLAQKIRQMGGEASLLEMRFLDPHDEQELTSRFQKLAKDNYSELLTDCASAIIRVKNLGSPPTGKEMEDIRRMVKRYRHAKAKDYFHVASDVKEIEDGLSELIENVRSIAADVGKQLQIILDT